jgi:ubiquinone/menaquinone biosynthesis C-methylase UbiE
MSPNPNTVLRVIRTKAQAKESYNRMSSFYDYFTGPFEQKYRNMALKSLNITKGETVLEIGSGTGYCLKQIAETIGNEGRACGADISSGMIATSKLRLEKNGLWDRVELILNDAMRMPYRDNIFDVVFSSFTLELFDSPEIPQVLAEIKRILKPNGKVGILSISSEGKSSFLLKLYEWLHQRIPQYVDCRPIFVEQSIKDVGFVIDYKEIVNLMGMLGEIVIGVKQTSSG